MTDKSGKNGFIIKKENFDTKDIIRKEIENGVEKLIDSDRFHKKYELIYDIPDNPLERLKDLTNSVKLQQTKWNAQLARLREFVNQNIKELERRKSEYDIEEIKKKISKVREDQAFNTNGKTQSEQKLSRLQKYYYLRKYKETKNEYDSVRVESRDVNREKRKTNDELGEHARDFKLKLQERGKIMGEVKDLKGTIIQNVSVSGISDFPGYSNWIKKVKQAPTSDSIKEDLEIINKLDGKCDELIEEFKGNSSIVEVEFYDKLVSWIRENMSSNYQIPGMEMTFSTLVGKLEGFVNSNRESFKKKKNLKNIKEWINDLKKKITEYNEISTLIGTKYKEISSAQRDSKYEEISESGKELNEKKMELKTQLQSLFLELKKFNIEDPEDVQEAYNVLLLRFPELNAFGTLSLQKIDNDIRDLKSSINVSSEKEQKDKFRIEMLENQLKNAEKMGPHKYQGKMRELSVLLDSIGDLIKKISEWERLIDKYKGKEDASNNNYFRKVSLYLAHRMKYVNHIDRRYELKEVDLINSRFIAMDGTRIHFQVMGTGQRQLTYIMNKLNYDGKKILAMFDEVATMSETTMQPIVNKMMQLREEGKLLLGLLVSPSEEVKIKQW